MSSVNPDSADTAPARRLIRWRLSTFFVAGALYLGAGLASASTWRPVLLLFFALAMLATAYQTWRLGQWHRRNHGPGAPSLNWRNQASLAAWSPLVVVVLTSVTVAMVITGAVLVAVSVFRSA